METVRQAILRLKNAGVVVSRQGAGVFVRTPATPRRLARNRLSRTERDAGRGAFLTDAAAGGFQPDVQLTIRIEVADEQSQLGLEPGEEILVRDRVMLADGEPVMLATSRLPRGVTRGTPIEDPNPGPGGIYARLEEQTGKTLSFVETVTARMPTPDEANALHLGPGIPILQVQRTAYAAEAIVEANAMTLVGPRYELVYEID